ncbi:IS3 family transposase [Saccharibacillus sacchari]|uniref:IS3 family transposase n=1 Tax=Saccharibacillus sacchari TaxID=456493 RepID=UPI001470BED5|nr:IS3 family transposase [Saccharibacillus sacchari]
MLSHLEGGKTQAKYALIRQVNENQTIRWLCQIFGVSRSGYYAWLKRQEATPEAADAKLVHAIYWKYNGIYGYRQLQLFLWQDCGIWMNHKKVLRLMQKLRIQARVRKKRRYRYTADAAGLVAENVLNQHFKADKPNEKWVTDITQYRVGERWLYLSAVKDLFNNEIVAYQIGEHPDKELVKQTFKKAFRKRKDVTGVVIHSDRGAPYTSHLYHDMLPKVGAQISMSRGGNCYDNASIESFFSHLKTEGLYPYSIRSLDEAQRRIEQYIRFYNTKRPQRKLNKLTPVEYRRQFIS